MQNTIIHNAMNDQRFLRPSYVVLVSEFEIWI